MELGFVLPGMPPIWIGMGKHSAWADLKESYPDHAFAGLHRSGHQWRIDLPEPLWIDLRSVRIRTLLGRPIALPVAEQAIVTFTARPQTVVGTDFFPNVVYFPAEGRSITETKKTRAELLDMMPFNWVARFDQKLSLDSVLLTVKVREPDRFADCLRLVNLALGHRGKRIAGFGENGRLVVEGEAESETLYRHPIEELSSGEKQMLLMLGYTAAFLLLQAGGCPLDAEYDLHNYGPYSQDVAQLADELTRANLLAEEAETDARGERYSYTLTQKSIDQIKRYELDARGLEEARAMETYEIRARALADVDVKELEVGATIVFFRGNGHNWLDAIEKTCSFKKLDANTPFLKRCEKLAREIVD